MIILKTQAGTIFSYNEDIFKNALNSYVLNELIANKRFKTSRSLWNNMLEDPDNTTNHLIELLNNFCQKYKDTIVSVYLGDQLFPASLVYKKDTANTNYIVTGYLGLPDEIQVPQKYLETTISEIASKAFLDCKSLVKITLPNELSTIGKGAFLNCLNLTDINIPDKVTQLNADTFYGCQNLKTIALPKTLKSIGEKALAECINLVQLNIPAGVETIASKAFYNCYNLGEVTLPNNITSISEKLFAECRSLKQIKIPNSVTNIESKAFYNCKTLTTITIPNSVTNIGIEAFANCENLTTVTLSPTVNLGDNLEKSVFENCTKLTTVYFSGTDSQWATIRDKEPLSSPLRNAKVLTQVDIESENFGYQIISNTDTCILRAYTGTDSDIEIQSSVKAPNAKNYTVCAIGAGVFSGKNIEKVQIPKTISSIENEAFAETPALKEVTFAEDAILETIGEGVFYKSAIEKIELPTSVTSIGSSIFESCENLEEVSLGNIVDIPENAFYECEKLTTVNISSSQLRTIKEQAFYNCRELKTIFKPNTGIINIPNTVIAIGQRAFYDCKGLTGTLVIPKSTKTLEQQAFEGTCINKVNLEKDSIEIINDRLFANCTNLRYIFIPKSVISMDLSALYNCLSTGEYKVGKIIEIRYEGNSDEWSNIKKIYTPYDKYDINTLSSMLKRLDINYECDPYSVK